MIDHNPTTTPASYGILDETVRYIDDLPYTWQPEGLPAPEADPLDPSDPEKNTPVFVNALSEDDNHKAYLYFIPQDNAATAADQALILTTCQIDYVIVSTSGTTTPGSKETTGTVTVANPLRGNRTYHLKLNLKLS